MNIHPNQLAFPTPAGHTGLTKREYFAAIAMQGLLANNRVIDLVGEMPVRTESSSYAVIADWSVLQADALIERLAK